MVEYLVILILGLVTVGAVAFPFVTGVRRYDDPGELESDLRRYREALAAGTVCSRCRAANRPAHRFCTECGREL